MDSSSLDNNTTTMTQLDEFIATPLISPDNELEVWFRTSLLYTTTAINITTSPRPSVILLAANETMKFLPVFESPIVSAMKLAIFMMIRSPLGTACVQGCSDVFRSSLVSIVGPSKNELLAPFHGIIAKSRTNIAAQRKIAWVCHSVRKFQNCMNPCVDSKAKAIRMVTIHQWQMICDASKKYPKHFGEFIGCERRHHERALRKCPVLRVSMDTSLNLFCKSINDYVDCYSAVPFKCSSKNATEIWAVMNDAIKQSYSRLLELTAGRLELPVECEWAMRNSDLYRYEDEGLPGKEEYLVESLTWKTTEKAPLIATETTSKPELLTSPSLSSTTSINPTYPHHKHRGPDTSEYNVDYWQGVSEQPLMQPLSTSTTQKTRPVWTSTEIPSDYQNTPVSANTFKNFVSSSSLDCSTLWLLTSTFVSLIHIL